MIEYFSHFAGTQKTDIDFPMETKMIVIES
jgi:hypothetical protein